MSRWKCGTLVASRPSVSNGDDDLPSSLSRFQVVDRLGDLAQRERPVDYRRDLPLFDQLLQEDESVSGVLGPPEGMQLATKGEITISFAKRPRLPNHRWPDRPYWSNPLST